MPPAEPFRRRRRRPNNPALRVLEATLAKAFPVLPLAFAVPGNVKSAAAPALELPRGADTFEIECPPPASSRRCSQPPSS